ncbi:MAG: MDR family MFS transporter [Ilumatobacteraceae bacterium]
MATATRVDQGITLPHKQLMVIFSGLMLGMTLAALDQTIVATALPTITSDLGGLDHLSWVVTAYLLAATVSTPVYGKLGDLYGRKHLFQFTIVVFLAGSIACGLAQSMVQLIAFRAVQGLGGGGLMVLAQAIIADVVSPRDRGRYQGYFGAVFGAASVFGPLLGGFLTDSLSWRWVFYVNVPFGIAALVVTSAVLPEAHRRPGRASIDYAGAAVLTAAATCVILFTTFGGQQFAWGSPTIVGLIIASVLLFGALVIVERRATEPMLPASLFRSATFNISVAVSFILGIALYGAISFLPMFLQVVGGSSATDSGLLILPLMAGLLTASVTSGRLITRTGRYKVFPVTGTAIVSVSLVLLGLMDERTPRGAAMGFMVLLGIGIGLTLSTLVLAIQNSVEREHIGTGTSSANFFRSLGGSIGVAAFGAVFTARLTSRLSELSLDVTSSASAFDVASLDRLSSSDRRLFDHAFAESLTPVFLMALPLALIAWALTTRLREIPLRTHDHPLEGAAAVLH